jgi:hypothetical protein
MEDATLQMERYGSPKERAASVGEARLIANPAL